MGVAHLKNFKTLKYSKYIILKIINKSLKVKRGGVFTHCDTYIQTCSFILIDLEANFLTQVLKIRVSK